MYSLGLNSSNFILSESTKFDDNEVWERDLPNFLFIKVFQYAYMS